MNGQRRMCTCLYGSLERGVGKRHLVNERVVELGAVRGRVARAQQRLRPCPSTGMVPVNSCPHFRACACVCACVRVRVRVRVRAFMRTIRVRCVVSCAEGKRSA
jgi:hypothetical protein